MKAEETWAEQATYMYDFHIQELQETGSMWEKLLKKYLGNIPGKKFWIQDVELVFCQLF